MVETETLLKASDLRVGNIILLDTGFTLPAPHAVKAQDIADIASGKITITAIEPIELTPEILEKAGFNDRYSKDGRFLIASNDLNIISDEGTIAYSSECKYIHQLQNLFFALTGTELKINL